ncbi:P68 family surface lipoprotein [Mycoplasma sp. 'Moose RK']|uniref:P68 family surface lipoprotein n=1 Tax=Mycoplasma sp. 'Moose RK' TaxID=2780095 RepID=UPI0018C23180|nr:P80 family lipoprotein [Mycoplasma sp. 'Moose RK']MBG0730897.1 P80 family lipoprotein [Mycoplasma sp. 'Moose RK']
MLKKIKKSKGLLLLPIFISAASLISCYTKSDSKFGFDGNQDGKLQMVTSWTTEQARFKALNQVVQIWNSKPEVLDTTNREFLPIKLTPSYDVDYAPMATKFSQVFSAKDKAQTINLVLNYPAAAAIAAKYKMLLNLKDFPDLTQKIKEIYHSKFLETNSKIATLSEDGIYTIPFVKSSQTLVVDGPVMAYIIEKALENGARIKQGEEEFFSQFRKSESDLPQIKKLWQLQSFEKVANPWANFEFSQDIFKYFDQLFDFALRIKKSFKLEPANTDFAYFPFGFDDIPNLLFSKIFASAGADYAKFMFEVLKDEGKNMEQISFSKLYEKNSQNYLIAKKNYDQILELFKADAFFYPGRFSEPSFANLFMNHHEIAFAISSTSNYERRFSRAISNFVIKNGDKKEKFPISENSQIYQIIPFGLTENRPKNALLKLKGVLTNQISFLISDKTPDFPDANIYIDPKNQNLILKVKKITDSLSKNQDIFLALDSRINQFFQKLAVNSAQISIENLTGNQNENNIFLIKSAWIENVGGDKNLNENELVFLQEPLKNSKNDPKNVITYQGPDLIAFHSNEEEDIATKNFLKWILGHKQDFFYKTSTGESKFSGSPAEYVAFRGNYLAPTSENFQSSLTNKSKFRQNNALRTAFKNFKQVNDDPESNVFYIDPIDSRSSLIREVILASLNQMGRVVLGGHPEKADFDSFLSALRTNLYSIRIS